MARLELDVGYFPGSIPYAKVGKGKKNVLFLSGGPGNDPPHHMEVSMCLGGLKSVTDEYTFWITSRKNGQPENYGTREMAADTAAAIKQVFPGGIEAAMGMSYGGLIAQYLAADFCGLVPKYVFVVTAYRCSSVVAEADLRFAQCLAAGRNGRAFYEVGGYLFSPGLKRSLMRGLMFLVGAFISSKHHSDYKTDVIKEARMEAKHNSMDVLGHISDPVLLVGGDCDLAFPKELQEETAAAIPGAQLILYEGRGHGEVTSHKRFAQDVLEFLR
jgi:pimeloyl-ACP methyl ester carboxylesterase